MEHTSQPQVDDDPDLDSVSRDLEPEDEHLEERTKERPPDMPPVEPIAGELARQTEQYDAATRAEKRAEGVDEDPDDHVFDGPYNADAAMLVILESHRETEAAAAEWKQSAEETKGFKNTYDEAVKRHQRLCRRFDGQRRDRQQPALKTLSEDERNGETADIRRRRLAQQLPALRGFYVSEQALVGLSREDLDTLDVWIQRAGPVPPALLARAHIAGDSGEVGAFCTRCGARLGRPSDNGDYPVDAFVGIDCQGEETADARQQRLTNETGEHVRHRERKAKRATTRAKAPHTPPRRRR